MKFNMPCPVLFHDLGGRSRQLLKYRTLHRIIYPRKSCP
ncbi:hypothetical protein DCCM_0124 [Desulfocucumis palustris]|uniref:Uncharacterized protein n=1 Tax=Desulfocucumis palustris TaxID=1898651 RepID=A0A2L2XCJ3_9FIRM|nr:hypothetical protein DCCM_0124 [Desulfocucumis palustris]